MTNRATASVPVPSASHRTVCLFRLKSFPSRSASNWYGGITVISWTESKIIFERFIQHTVVYLYQSVKFLMSYWEHKCIDDHCLTCKHIYNLHQSEKKKIIFGAARLVLVVLPMLQLPTSQDSFYHSKPSQAPHTALLASRGPTIYVLNNTRWKGIVRKPWNIWRHIEWSNVFEKHRKSQNLS